MEMRWHCDHGGDAALGTFAAGMPPQDTPGTPSTKAHADEDRRQKCGTWWLCLSCLGHTCETPRGHAEGGCAPGKGADGT